MKKANLYFPILSIVRMGLLSGLLCCSAVSAVLEDAETVAKVQQSVVSIRSFYVTDAKMHSRVGSGFVLDKGIVVTWRNVVEKADSISVTLSDGRATPARLVGWDDDTDLFLLRIRDENVPPLGKGCSDNLPMFTPLILLGNSLGIFPSVTLGTFSEKRADGLLEINCWVPPGNSGGPVLNSSGKLVGMIIGRVHKEQGHENRQAIAGLALPVERINEGMNRFLKNMIGGSGWIGVSVVNLENPFGRGSVRVVQLVPDGPADQAGICSGDTLIRMNGGPIRNAAELARVVRNLPPNSSISFSIQNGKKSVQKQIKVGCLP